MPHRRRQPDHRHAVDQGPGSTTPAKPATTRRSTQNQSRYRRGICRRRNGSSNLLAAGHTQRSVPRGWTEPATISREVRRNISGAGNYRPFGAQQSPLPPAPAQIGQTGPRQQLRDLRPAASSSSGGARQQICHALPIEFPGQTERHLVHETLYQALYVQGRCANCDESWSARLRTGRARRKPHRRGDARRQGSIVDPSVMISERPAEADDRAIPGHWEGDLITGEGNRSAIGTWLVGGPGFDFLGFHHRLMEPAATCRSITPPKQSAMPSPGRCSPYRRICAAR